MKKQVDLTYMKLGIARQYELEKKINEKIPSDDPKNRLFKQMVSEGICGISALASLGTSTVEWNRNIKSMLDKMPSLVRIENPLVIIGESGTGKESMARVLHWLANGSDKRFIPVNCSAIPDTMLESELFGYEKGAFTGAENRRIGLIETAKGGSIFLDELGKMGAHLQHKLLRVIEERKLRRLGSEKDTPIDDVKFIIALQPGDVKDAIVPDLLNRLNLYNAIDLPPLTERLKADPNITHDVLMKMQLKMDLMTAGERKKVDDLMAKVNEAKDRYEKSLRRTDVRKIRQRADGHVEADEKIIPDQLMMTKESAQHFKKYIKLSAELSLLKSPVRLSPKAEDYLVNYDGYGGKNFRELENVLKTAILNAHIARRKVIELNDLPKEVRNPSAKTTVTATKEENKANFFDELMHVLLKDIIKHADEIKKSIVQEKILSIVRRGGNIKSTLKSEGAIKKESDYTGFYKKLERILGKAFIKDIRT